MSDWFRRALLEKGLLKAERLLRIENHPAFAGLSLVEKVYRSGLVDDVALVDLFVQKGAVDGTNAVEGGLPPPAALGALQKKDAERFRALPISVSRARVTVALLDPSEPSVVDALSFRTGLLVEPCAMRASVLFKALHDAYGIPLVTPDPTPFVIDKAFVGDDEIPDELPPPSATLPQVRVVPPREPVGDPSSSPLALGLARAASGDAYLAPPSSDAPSFGWLRERGPSTPTVPSTTTAVDVRAHRDSLPPQVLPFLVPPFRSAVLFLVRKDVAVGWDGVGPSLAQEKIRDVLLPLTAPSAFARAWGHGMVAEGSVDDASTVEHIFFRFLGAAPPSAFTVLPILVGQEPTALLYVDVEQGVVDERLLANARQVGGTLADGLAPLVAKGTLFGP